MKDMMEETKRELEKLQSWGIQAFARHNIVLVVRRDAKTCVQRILEEGHEFLGFDAFTICADGSIQPSMEWSRDYSRGVPPVHEILAVIESAAEQLTHFEFVFVLKDAQGSNAQNGEARIEA